MRKTGNKKGLLICISLLAFLFLGLKCLISTKGATDELYYIATSYRFYQGDAMLVDDWNAAQMSGFLLLPFVHVYMLIMKTTEGIVLYFRFLYLIFKVLVTAFCMTKLKKYGAFGIAGISVYYFFSPQNLDSLSYNTIALGMVMMIGAVCLAEEKKKRDYYLCGIFLAMAILAQPFCILIYFAGAAVVAGKVLTQKPAGRWQPLKAYAFVTAGAFTMFVIFMLFVFSRASWHEVLENLHFILNDKNHNVTGVGGVVNLILKPLKTGYHILKNYTALTIINTVYFLIVLAMKHSKKECADYLAYGSVLCLIFSCVAVMAAGRSFPENEFFLPFIWFSLEEAVLIGKKKEKYKYICVWGLAVLTALAFCLSTDTGIISTSAGLCIAAVFSVVMLPNIITGEKPKIVGEKGLLVLGIGISICMFTMRMLCTWTDSLITGDYSHYIGKGPLKGTYTDEASYQRFYNIMSDLDRITYTEDDILFCGRNTPLAYLYSNMICGTMSTYLLETDYERLEQYYTLHPDKFPTVVYYYPWGSYPVTEQDTDSGFFQYINSHYEVLEVEDRILAAMNSSKR